MLCLVYMHHMSRRCVDQGCIAMGISLDARRSWTIAWKG